MPRIKKTSKLARNHGLMSFLFFIPLVTCFAYVYLMGEMQTLFQPEYLILAVFPILAVGFWLQNRRWVRMKCPDCNRLLKREEKLDGQPLTFRCEDCDIIWDTGFTDQMDC